MNSQQILRRYLANVERVNLLLSDSSIRSDASGETLYITVYNNKKVLKNSGVSIQYSGNSISSASYDSNTGKITVKTNSNGDLNNDLEGIITVSYKGQSVVCDVHVFHDYVDYYNVLEIHSFDSITFSLNTGTSTSSKIKADFDVTGSAYSSHKLQSLSLIEDVRFSGTTNEVKLMKVYGSGNHEYITASIPFEFYENLEFTYVHPDPTSVTISRADWENGYTFTFPSDRFNGSGGKFAIVQNKYDGADLYCTGVGGYQYKNTLLMGGTFTAKFKDGTWQGDYNITCNETYNTITGTTLHRDENSSMTLS